MGKFKSMIKEEIEQLSTEELQALLKKRKNDSAKFKVMQLGLKVTLNSAYGMIGNEYSRYYDVRIAEGITVSGQLSIQWIQRKLNEFLNKHLGVVDHDFSIAGDTDSIYLSLNPLVEKYCQGKTDAEKVKFLDRTCEKIIQPYVDKSYEELKEYMNAFQQKMKMSREVIADVGVWRAKKNYALNVHNSEGVQYDEPKLKIMGMESVRSSTPEVCRKAFKKGIEIILTKGEDAIQKYIKDFKKDFLSHSVEDISFPRGVNDITKWLQTEGFKLGTPIHVKAAISYNRLLNVSEYKNRYRSIRNGDKIKFIYLKKANPTKNNAIAYPDILPPEFELEDYIDYNLQFEKTFLGPIKSVLDVIGWTDKKVISLEEMFG